jgi:hypothetical protein
MAVKMANKNSKKRTLVTRSCYQIRLLEPPFKGEHGYPMTNNPRFFTKNIILQEM